MILRRLDHPNIIKLEGLITSQMSRSLYLVFEYMEHDLTGLASNPGIKFSEPQVLWMVFRYSQTSVLCGISLLRSLHTESCLDACTFHNLLPQIKYLGVQFGAEFFTSLSLDGSTSVLVGYDVQILMLIFLILLG